MRAKLQARSSGRQRSRGLGMIEVLIGMVVVALWLLSNAGLTLNALRFQKSADSRMTAVSLASELGERMETNYRAAQSGQYALPATNTAPNAARDCAAQTCQPVDLAAYDLAQWTARAASALKLTEVSVTNATPVGGVTTYSISVTWEEPRGRRAHQDTSAQSETMSYTTTKLVRNEAM